MKSTLYSPEGKSKGQVDLPKLFSTKIREDIVAKYFEADKFVQPYATKKGAGMRQSASGTISHKRHDWKGHYGRGYSRAPRKTMWRRGTQFFWVGANAPGTRGGRKAHFPKGIGKEKKMNKKEVKLAFNSAFAATASPDYVKNRYSSMDKIETVPIILESLPKKTKELTKTMKEAFSNNTSLTFKKKTVRAGKGSLRGRKYKSTAGALIITSSKEETKFKGLDVKHISEVTISDLYPLGRLTVYTKQALEEMEAKQ
jgi:large subunit ribosomal protein L4e